MGKSNSVTPAPVAGPFFVRLNGVGYEFGERPTLKGKKPALPAVVDGAASSVVIIKAREFGDNRVWVKLGNGKVGRFLVPAGVDLSGSLEIETVLGAVKYDRESLRLRPVVRRVKAESPVIVEEAKVEA